MPLRAVKKFVHLKTWASQSPEDREAVKKEKEFLEWAKEIKPGWVPGKLNRGPTIFK